MGNLCRRLAAAALLANVGALHFSFSSSVGHRRLKRHKTCRAEGLKQSLDLSAGGESRPAVDASIGMESRMTAHGSHVMLDYTGFFIDAEEVYF